MNAAKAILAVLSCCAGLAAQQTVWTRSGIPDQLLLRDRPVFVGDVDRDGFVEVVVSGALYDSGWSDKLLWLSGRDGSVVQEVLGPTACYGIYSIAPAGDMDGDGHPDLAVRMRDRVCGFHVIVEVWSGRTGLVLWRVLSPERDGDFGVWMAGGGDVNGDGRPDLLVTIPTHSTGAQFRAYDHRGQLLWIAPGGATQVDFVRDLDGDGCDEVIVGFAVSAIEGAAQVISGRTRQVLHTVRGDLPLDGLGLVVRGCGDLDGDGLAEFVAASDGRPPYNSVIKVFRGRDGTSLYTWRDPPYVGLSACVEASADMDQDGVQDILAFGADTQVTSPVTTVVHGFSGRTGERILRFAPKELSYRSIFGLRFALGPPRPGSRFPTLAAMEPQYGRSSNSLNWIGRVHLQIALPEGAREWGEPCKSASGDTPWIGFQDRGNRLARIQLHGAEPGAPAFLLLGLSTERFGTLGLPAGLETLGLPGCALHTSVEVVGVARTGTSGLERGYAWLEVPGGVRGTSPWSAQWLVFPRAGTWPPSAITPALLWGW